MGTMMDHVVDVSIKIKDADWDFVGQVKSKEPQKLAGSLVSLFNRPLTAKEPIISLGVVQDQVSARIEAAERLPILLLQDIICKKLKERNKQGLGF